ncbi:MlaD family protein [Nocardia shimofusensis]|uniref:MlaD family protein n=1 Tax=Nocardia shimofusensis TaxID=228596 RepID=UPI00082C079B|nr:MlaD family protein [Nocardia shimofusensis]
MTRIAKLRRTALAALCCGVLATSACSLGPDDLPSVRGGIGDGHAVYIEFAGIMNLPGGADVMMDGLRVGEVREVTVQPDTVKVTVKLKEGLQVPTDVRAVIRQDTLLGDTYIALDHGEVDSAGPFLAPEATIPVERTSSPPQLEDTMAVLAYFVNGGSIQRIQDAMGRINAVMPAQGDVRRLASVVATDLRDLAGGTGEIDRLLDGFDATAVAVNSRSEMLTTIFSQDAEHYWRRVAVSIVSYISQILPSVGSVYEGGLWLVPMLNSLAATGGVVRGIWDEGPATTAKLADFLRLTVLPFAENPSVNLRSIESSNGDQLVADVENLLRMLGAVR